MFRGGVCVWWDQMRTKAFSKHCGVHETHMLHVAERRRDAAKLACEIEYAGVGEVGVRVRGCRLWKGVARVHVNQPVARPIPAGFVHHFAHTLHCVAVKRYPVLKQAKCERNAEKANSSLDHD